MCAPSNDSLGRILGAYVRRSLWSCLLQQLLSHVAVASKGMPWWASLLAMAAAMSVSGVAWW